MFASIGDTMSTYERLSRQAATLSPYVLSVVRLVLGLLFIEHGSMKLFHFPYSDQFKDLNLLSLEGVAGVMEFFGGLLLLFGFRTRIVAFLLSGLMACAYFIAHAPHGFFPALNMGEPAVIYSFLFLYLAAVGGGAWSIDEVIRGRHGVVTGNDEWTLAHPAE
jgi:putative oxidoreductase